MGTVNVPSGSFYVTKTSGDAIAGIISSGGSGKPYYLRSNTSGSFAIYDDTACLERLTILSGGNIGIGTTSPDYKLEVESTSDADLISVKSTAIANNTQMRLGISGNDSVISGTGGSTGALSFKTYGTQRMYINSSGNVGIGTGSPSTPLNVVSAYSSGTITTSLKLATLGGYNSGSGTALEFGQDQGTYATWVSGKISSPRTGDNYGGSLTFSTNRNSSATNIVEAMRIDSFGNIGIGMTPDTSWGSDCTVLNIGIGNADAGHLAWREISGADQLSVGWNLYHDNTDWRYASTNPASLYTQRVGEHTFFTAVSGSADAIVSWTQAMSINTTGTITLEGDKTITTANTLRLNAGGGTLYLDSSTDVLIRTNGTSQAFVAKADGDVYNYQSGNKANTYYGYNAGNYGGAGLSNTAIGYDASPSLAAGANNISIGRDAGKALTIGTLNVSIGNGAGFSNVDGTQNTYIGHYAGYTSPGQNYNTFVGRECGYHNTANEGTAVGRNAMHANTSGFGNTAMGAQALTANQTGDYNTAIGYQAQSNSTTAYNTAVGYRAGYYFTTGEYNTCVGFEAGMSTASAATGSYNTLIGTDVNGSANGLTGNENTMLGYTAGYSSTSGEYNTYLGFKAGYSGTTGYRNTAVGRTALQNNTGSYNTAVGMEALLSNTSGQYNTSVGLESLVRNSVSSKNTGVGMYAGAYYGQDNTSEIESVFIGYGAGLYRTAGNECVFVGANAGYQAGTGSGITAVGRYAGYALTSGQWNTFVGHQAGIACDTGTRNTGIGKGALDSVTEGDYNTALGSAAGDEATTGDYNICIGHGAGSGSSPFQLTTESGRVVIGDNSISNSYIKVDWTVTSDKRDKTEFKEIEHGLDFVNKLKPTEYKFRKNRDTEETDGKRRYGFIAQEILELEGDNPVIIDKDQENSLKYKQSHLVPVLVKAIQELKAEIEILKSK